MAITLSDEAHTWFKEEMDAVPGDAIRFFARYGGASPLHAGFSLGVTKEAPDEVAVESTYDDIRYYIEQRDEWFFTGHDLHVDVDRQLGELTFAYKKS